jgi:hypothetical protein
MPPAATKDISSAGAGFYISRMGAVRVRRGGPSRLRIDDGHNDRAGGD